MPKVQTQKDLAKTVKEGNHGILEAFGYHGINIDIVGAIFAFQPNPPFRTGIGYTQGKMAYVVYHKNQNNQPGQEHVS